MQMKEDQLLTRFICLIPLIRRMKWFVIQIFIIFLGGCENCSSYWQKQRWTYLRADHISTSRYPTDGSPLSHPGDQHARSERPPGGVRTTPGRPTDSGPRPGDWKPSQQTSWWSICWRGPKVILIISCYFYKLWVWDYLVYFPEKEIIRAFCLNNLQTWRK